MYLLKKNFDHTSGAVGENKALNRRNITSQFVLTAKYNITSQN